MTSGDLPFLVFLCIYIFSFLVYLRFILLIA